MTSAGRRHRCQLQLCYKMRNRCFLIMVLICGVAFAMPAMAAETAPAGHETLSLKPQMLVQFRGFGITNSMLVTWIVAAGDHRFFTNRNPAG